MKFLATDISKDCFVNIMEQYHPDAYVGKPRARSKQSAADKGDNGSERRYADINRAVTTQEITSVRKAAEAAGLWRFCDPPRHDGFSL